MQGKPVAEQDIGRQLLQETAAYAETSICRRKFLLHYFGEEYEPENCGKCDNCLHPRERVKAVNELRDDFSRNNYGKPFASLNEEQQEIVKTAIPQNISEAEPKDVTKR